MTLFFFFKESSSLTNFFFSLTNIQFKRADDIFLRELVN